MIEALQEQIKQEIAGSRVHLYMKGTPDMPQCGFSKASCDVFRAIGVDFTATNVLLNLDGYRAALGAMTSWPTIPQIFVDGEFIGGSDILIEMFQKGEIQQMLATTGSAAADTEQAEPEAAAQPAH